MFNFFKKRKQLEAQLNLEIEKNKDLTEQLEILHIDQKKIWDLELEIKTIKLYVNITDEQIAEIVAAKKSAEDFKALEDKLSEYENKNNDALRQRQALQSGMYGNGMIQGISPYSGMCQGSNLAGDPGMFGRY